ncbi:hypothetical protein E2C01_002820 [Portunus trituberculatus]|uniref:Uncharacterized protein n=1 Tax=Portunus trituberculatus TaxID=210409 RepID=A0A5B7CKX8_PORTR|nr:hypothetical protein [Portunus trituberculatus]
MQQNQELVSLARTPTLLSMISPEQQTTCERKKHYHNLRFSVYTIPTLHCTQRFHPLPETDPAVTAHAQPTLPASPHKQKHTHTHRDKPQLEIG